MSFHFLLYINSLHISRYKYKHTYTVRDCPEIMVSLHKIIEHNLYSPNFGKDVRGHTLGAIFHPLFFAEEGEAAFNFDPFHSGLNLNGENINVYSLFKYLEENVLYYKEWRPTDPMRYQTSLEWICERIFKLWALHLSKKGFIPQVQHVLMLVRLIAQIFFICTGCPLSPKYYVDSRETLPILLQNSSFLEQMCTLIIRALSLDDLSKVRTADETMKDVGQIKLLCMIEGQILHKS